MRASSISEIIIEDAEMIDEPTYKPPGELIRLERLNRIIDKCFNGLIWNEKLFKKLEKKWIANGGAPAV